jgi:hypothetical protein
MPARAPLWVYREWRARYVRVELWLKVRHRSSCPYLFFVFKAWIKRRGRLDHIRDGEMEERG